jgi:hypothetical protein
MTTKRTNRQSTKKGKASKSFEGNHDKGSEAATNKEIYNSDSEEERLKGKCSKKNGMTKPDHSKGKR